MVDVVAAEVIGLVIVVVIWGGLFALIAWLIRQLRKKPDDDLRNGDRHLTG